MTANWQYTSSEEWVKSLSCPSIQRLKWADRSWCLPHCVPADHILLIGLSKHHWAPSTAGLWQGLQGDLNTMRDHPNLPSGWDNEIVTSKTVLSSLCPLKFYGALKARLIFSPSSFPWCLRHFNRHLWNLSYSALLLASVHVWVWTYFSPHSNMH